MALDPQIVAALKLMDEAGLKPIERLSVADGRAQMEAVARLRNLSPLPVGRVEDRVMATEAGDIPARFYWPAESTGGALPIVVFYHGGGHVIGSPNTHDAATREMSNATGAIVVSVDYRMGPEHLFPAAANDAVASLGWIHAHASDLGGDPERIAVAGDSAGGNLAAVAAIVARDVGEPAIRLQALIYPLVDYSLESESYKTYGNGFGLLTEAAVHWFRDRYLTSPEQAADWRVSPIRAASLKGVAPALIVAAECDVLVDEGVAYAEALRQAGVDVEYSSYPGMIHGFYTMAPAIDAAVTAQAQVNEALKRALA